MKIKKFMNNFKIYEKKNLIENWRLLKTIYKTIMKKTYTIFFINKFKVCDKKKCIEKNSTWKCCVLLVKCFVFHFKNYIKRIFHSYIINLFFYFLDVLRLCRN